MMFCLTKYFTCLGECHHLCEAALTGKMAVWTTTKNVLFSLSCRIMNKKFTDED